MKRTLQASRVAEEPHLVWNEFIALLAEGDYAAMTALQRQAHLSFWYDAEVQNGGHRQYFENPAGRRCREAVAALRGLRLESQAEILYTAIDLWESRARTPSRTAGEFAAACLEGEFDRLDKAYYECSPSVMDALEGVLTRHRDEFVVIQ